MGLDNGIIMKRVKEDILSDIPDFVKYEIYYNEDKTIDIELAYWRKCWNVRDAIIEAINPEYDPSDYADCDIDADDIPAIIRALTPLFSKEEWEDGRSIWTFEEEFDNMLQIMINLKWLESYLNKTDEDIKIRFYDSF